MIGLGPWVEGRIKLLPACFRNGSNRRSAFAAFSTRRAFVLIREFSFSVRADAVIFYGALFRGKRSAHGALRVVDLQSCRAAVRARASDSSPATANLARSR